MGNSRGGVARARGILQHDVRWMQSLEFSATFADSEGAGGGGGEKARLERMWRLLLKMEQSAGPPETLGYSQR